MLAILLIQILSISLIPRVYSLEFSVNKYLNNGKEISDKKQWFNVKIFDNCFSEDDVAIQVSIPKSLNLQSPDVNVFFANDEKEIFKASLNKTFRGEYFSIPYKMEKTMVGPRITQNDTPDYLALYVKFPKAWLPEKCSRVSASILTVDGKIYNYYGIFNSEISIPDLMIVEQYAEYKCDSQ